MIRQVNEILIYGRNMVHDAVVSSRPVGKILVQDNIKGESRLSEITRLAKNKNIPVENVGQRDLDALSEKGYHQGIAAYMSLPEETSLEMILKNKRDAFILLFGPLDYEQNLGSIIRSAWAAGVDAIIVSPSGVHEITPVVAKVSMGGAAYVPVISQSLFQAISLLNKYAVKVIGVEVGLGEIYTESNLTGAAAFVFGGESNGLTQPLIDKCDSLVHIPMVQSVASINVSMASTLICFEKNRQERTHHEG